MNNKQILAGLAMDLKRVALGLHNNSFRMADIFLVEALKRKSEIDSTKILPYMQNILNSIDALADQDFEQKKENALMYSIRIQNYVLYK